MSFLTLVFRASPEVLALVQRDDCRAMSHSHGLNDRDEAQSAARHFEGEMNRAMDTLSLQSRATSEIRAQRDELAAALRDLLADVDSGAYDEVPSSHRAARDALAKVTP